MKKKGMIIVLVLVMLFACCSVAQARASNYISSCSASIRSGDSRGEVDIIVSVQARVSTTEIGATRIKIYQSNGSMVASISGSTSNGLISTSGGRRFDGIYTYTGIPGTSYYAVVTCYAGNASGGDSRQGTTATVMAPY